MKKLMFAAAVMAACVAFGAGEITSANIVGYQAGEIPAGQFMALAVQFENVSGGQIAIKDLVKVADPVGTPSISAGDQIWLWDSAAGDWIKYFWRSGRGVTTPCWCKAGETTETTDTIGSGTTFFFSRGGTDPTGLTLSGQVRAFEGSQVYSVAAGAFVFMAYPWPMPLAIGGFEQYQTAPVGTPSISAGDQIWLWDSAGGDWIKYFWRSGRGVTTPCWCKAGETTETTDTIPSGVGFFFSRGGTDPETITFPAPTK